MSDPLYTAEREVPVTRFGTLSVDASAPSARVVRIAEFKRELQAAVFEVMHATPSGFVPADVETQYKNIANGHGLHTLACIYDAAVNPRNAVAYAKAQRLVRAQMGWLDRYHPHVSASAVRWCPQESERADEWESSANDAQDAAQRALARHPSGVAEIVAKIETTEEQIVASRHVLAVDRARLAVVTQGRVCV